MRQARLDDFCESDEGYLYSEEYYQTLLWMSPEKLREIVPALLDNATGQEIIQIESHETLIEKEQSVRNIYCTAWSQNRRMIKFCEILSNKGILYVISLFEKI